MEKDRLQGKLVVILHADVAGSTQLVQKDERLADERIQDAFHRFGDNIRKYNGRVLENARQTKQLGWCCPGGRHCNKPQSKRLGWLFCHE